MRIQELVKQYFNHNKEILEEKQPGLSSSRLLNELEDYCKNTQSANVNEFLRKLLDGEPLAYINGKKNFYGLDLKVNADVLIPRNETEQLVEIALNELNQISKATSEMLKIADIGTGSGAIIISLLKESTFAITGVAVDISQKALKLAKENYEMYKTLINKESRIKFLLGDRLQGVQGKQHVIITNPPYIMEKRDIQHVHQQVCQYEPHIALFLPDEDYFDWFNELFLQCFRQLHNEGIFLMEGHENHLEDLKILASEIGFVDIKILKDYTHRNRFLKARKMYNG